jgi:serine/threonine protein kinase
MRTRRRKGGRIVGEGYHSVVVYPAIPCKDGRDMTNKVSRVIKKTKRSIENLEKNLMKYNEPLLSALKRIDPKQKYFFYGEHCEPGELLPENIEDGVDNSDKQFSEILEKGDLNLSNYRKQHTITESQIKHIVNGVNKLHKNGIIHGDLYSRNIVFGDDDVPRIIDFGHALIGANADIVNMEKKHIKRLFPDSKTYNTKYWYVPKLRKEVYNYILAHPELGLKFDISEREK